MKRFLGTVIALFFGVFSYAQFAVKGFVLTNVTREPVLEATVTLQKDGKVVALQATNDKGFFEFGKLKQKGTYTVLIEHVGMERKSVNTEIINNVAEVTILVNMTSYFLEPLEVRSIRASEKAPFAKTNISSRDLAKSNLGADLPILLNSTPSVVVNSDAGNGFGYTGMRIRGTDATRINVTLNGIPYNDAESQGTYFVDLPDIASSVNSLQIQRGVGSSSNGAGAFGASVNLSTNEFNETPYANINNSYGSFGSWKNTIKVGTGLLNEHFTVDARISRLSSNGYIDRASTNLKSLYLSTAYIGKKTTLRFNLISGKEKTYQAWNGVPESQLSINRTYNSAGAEKPGQPYANETDNFLQNHFQLFLNHSFSKFLSLNTAAFLTTEKGYYEQYKGVEAELAAGSTSGTAFASYGLPNAVFNNDTISNTDLVRQLWLDNKFYGQIFSFQYKKEDDNLTFGGGWNRYDGKHFGNVIWANVGIPKDYRWYTLDAYKTDVNIYGKWEHSLSKKTQIYADLQYRKVHHTMNGFDQNPTVFVARDFSFFNPKAGFTYNFKGLQAFVSYALGQKEPNRSDFEAGANHQPKAEILHDFELGLEKRFRRSSFAATAYYMLYTDQLILTGEINDVGAYTRVNVPNSYRMGIELQGKVNVADWMNASANLTLSRNKIKRSDEYIDDYDNSGQILKRHENTDISFSPSAVGSFSVNFLPFKNTALNLFGKYVSRQYLDNTQDVKRSLKPYFVQDIRLTYTIRNKVLKECNLIGCVYNVFNKMYEPNGYTFSYIYGGKSTTENFYFPMAGTNFMAGINISL